MARQKKKVDLWARRARLVTLEEIVTGEKTPCVEIICEGIIPDTEYIVHVNGVALEKLIGVVRRLEKRGKKAKGKG